jgi:hypothetical protein
MITVIADAKYPAMWRVRLDDGTTSDMLNQDRAQELARLWAVTPPVRRKSVQVPLPPSPAHASTAATAVVLIVTPSRNQNGTRAYTKRGPLFDCKVDGRTIITRSTTPFCKAARVLLAEGAASTTGFVMRHAGSSHDALISTIGHAAGQTVADGSVGKPVFAPWVDIQKALSPATSRPPMRQNDPAATQAWKATARSGTLGHERIRHAKRTGSHLTAAQVADAPAGTLRHHPRRARTSISRGPLPQLQVQRSSNDAGCSAAFDPYRKSWPCQPMEIGGGATGNLSAVIAPLSVGHGAVIICK